MDSSILTNLLLNFLFIIIGLLFLALYYDFTKKPPAKGIVILTSAITILLCVLFSIKLTNGVYIDLRMIPFFLSSLYFGPVVSFVLMIAIIGFRYLILGGELIYLVMLNYAVAFMILWLFSKRFQRADRNEKLMFMVMVCASMTTLNLALGSIHQAEITVDEWVYLVLIPLTAGIISVLVAEMMRKLMVMKRKVNQEEKLQVVSRLAASISHEIRNPLTTSKGFLQLMKEEKNEEMQREFVDLSLSGIEQATNVIEEYLTFTRSSPEEQERIDVRQAIVELFENLRPLSPHISFHSQLMEGIYVDGHPHSFRKCMGNIMRNAIEAMPRGGELTVNMTMEKNLTIAISDSGWGMTKEQIARFGEPFFSTKDEGTGLGVMAANIIVHSMEGNIRVKSELNKGTTVYIELQAHV
ncbi:ATP-binding protein [Bacillus sp. KH172YL63]|uniref:ATP-binding protein n=1 Tax=Bacillus sp. KH172YL63 TaxID=2709784 RepID=UPI0013E482C7|nr:ATP-binding protein [Bacillus sp. KH172YL63]BCB02684.1 sensor histidine kinase [Bacillus sp. KH172YL63]